MKKSQFKKLKVGDTVFLKSTSKIMNMKQWDGIYFEDDEGCRWSRFIRDENLLKGEGATIINVPSYYGDVVTVISGLHIFEIPRKCIKNF